MSHHEPALQNEWRQLGVQQSRGWVHYAIHRPEPHIMLFRCCAVARHALHRNSCLNQTLYSWNLRLLMGLHTCIPGLLMGQDDASHIFDEPACISWPSRPCCVSGFLHCCCLLRISHGAAVEHLNLMQAAKGLPAEDGSSTGRSARTAGSSTEEGRDCLERAIPADYSAIGNQHELRLECMLLPSCLAQCRALMY